MTFEELFESRNGYWDGVYAMIHEGIYVRCIAIGSPTDYKLTELGKSLLDYESADVIVSPKKRGRKPKAQVEDFNLDDL